MFDVSHEFGHVDKQLTRYVLDHYKPVILVANKWDLVADMERQDFVDYIRTELPQLAWAPIQFVSAKTGKGVDALLQLAERLFERSHVQIGTAELNRVLKRATEERGPTRQSANVRIYYATQTTTAPPTFTVFCNDKRFLNKNYVRYLTQRLRAELDLGDLPIRLELRDKKEGESST
jgi:GTP-binding protein